MLISIDFETRSRVDIKKAGVHRYAMDPSTDILCMAWMLEGSEVALWLPGQPLPKILQEFVRDESAIFCAWNAEFEIWIWNFVGHARCGFPKLSPKRWHDTMGDAAMCSFPLALDKCAKAISSAEQKDSAGTRLINKLCKPRKSGDFYEYEDCPEDFIALYNYCKQDVITEAEIYSLLPAHVEGGEMDIQRFTWLTNTRGVPIDTTAVNIIKKRLDEHTEHLDRVVQRFTNGALDSARQRDKLLFHLEMNRKSADVEIALHEMKKDAGLKPGRLFPSRIPGMRLKNLQGETVEEVLTEWLNVSDYDRFLLECYVDINHASVAKFKRILTQLCLDDTVKSNIQYHGAGTGRDAARGFQLQNLPRFTSKEPDLLIETFTKFSASSLDLMFPVLKTASSLIRPMIAAPPGKKLVVSDFNQIEAVGTAWAAVEQMILQNFYAGIDPYIAQACEMYHITAEEVDFTKRQYGKIAILACGYQGSHKALTDFANLYDLELERYKAVEIVRRFRNSRPGLVAAWYSFNEAAIHAVNDAGLYYQPNDCAPCSFQMYGEHLTMTLPSGRKIWYPYAKVQQVIVNYEDPETGAPKKFTTKAVTCMWVSSYSHKWVRRGMSGGNFFQNYVQAICRDLLMDAQIRCEDAGYEIVGRVHDELIALCDDDPRYTIEEMNRLMEVMPEWAVNFPVKAEGYESRRYKK